MLNVGDVAPDFEAKASDGSTFRLYGRRGRATVIFFFPKAFTPGCTKETKLFAENYSEIQLARADLVGVSSDGFDKQCDFAKSTGAPFPMIGDESRVVCKKFGVLFPIIGVARRVTFVVDNGDHKILGRFEALLDVEHHRDEVLALLQRVAEERSAR